MSTLEPTCHSHHHLVANSGLCEFLHIPWLSRAWALGAVPSLSKLGKRKKAACSGFSLNSKLGTFEGWGSAEVVWDTWDLGNPQEDWRESGQGLWAVWSERQPAVPGWQLSKPAQISFPNRRKSVYFAGFPPILLEGFPWKKALFFFSFCNSHKTIKQYLLFFWSSFKKMANENMPDCPLSARNWDLCLPIE